MAKYNINRHKRANRKIWRSYTPAQWKARVERMQEGRRRAMALKGRGKHTITTSENTSSSAKSITIPSGKSVTVTISIV